MPAAAGFDEAALRHALPLAAGGSPGTPARFALALALFALRYARWLLVPAAGWRARLRRLPAGRHAYVYGSLQQQRALERIVAIDPQAVVVDRRVLPRRIVLRQALAALPSLWRAYRDGGPEARSLLAAQPRLTALATGRAAAWRELLRQLRPRCLVVASDTALAARAAVHEARRAGVPTVYVQHGCVTPAAPALSTDYALLDGAQALDTYRARGLGATQPALVGVARLGGARREADAALIAVCGGHLTPLRDLVRAARALQRCLPTRRVVLRPHPRQLRRPGARLWPRLLGLEVSDARRIGPAEFLANAAAVVAGSSSILMEAAAVGAGAVYYRALDARRSVAHRNESAFDASRVDPDDYYGFIAAGLCTVAADEAALGDAVSRAIAGAPQARLRARPYCDTLGGPYDGRSHELARERIARASLREALPLRSA